MVFSVAGNKDINKALNGGLGFVRWMGDDRGKVHWCGGEIWEPNVRRVATVAVATFVVYVDRTEDRLISSRAAGI